MGLSAAAGVATAVAAVAGCSQQAQPPGEGQTPSARPTTSAPRQAEVRLTELQECQFVPPTATGEPQESVNYPGRMEPRANGDVCFFNNEELRGARHADINGDDGYFKGLQNYPVGRENAQNLGTGQDTQETVAITNSTGLDICAYDLPYGQGRSVEVPSSPASKGSLEHARVTRVEPAMTVGSVAVKSGPTC
ncbi:hypothetical protein DEF23_08675 [Marinitenerispora sediminis]|uniref:Uncharacterized protein n=2 Tax=Marinitenerispora sediminis TaxID=1931232 RepID=A0A368T5Z3_9ACTN|nr:hypothetical protein DEF28_10770 [Marinitenerispora sediminis]RCV58530.1 hypothetical protein DEF23_08675 [Marinitenerispora sediminis]RCV58853.1 hypothetical protein DEF24_11925 [Marinitenerispora sediminis]